MGIQAFQLLAHRMLPIQKNDVWDPTHQTDAFGSSEAGEGNSIGQMQKFRKGSYTHMALTSC